jgi:hypothetical protein
MIINEATYEKIIIRNESTYEKNIENPHLYTERKEITWSKKRMLMAYP